MTHRSGIGRWNAWTGVLLASLLSGLSGTTLAAQEVSVAAGVTVDGVEQGMRLYHSKGTCVPCHGELGVGTVEGPGFLTGRWKLGSGSYEWLQHITRHAGWGATGRAGDPQPMRGPTVLDSTEVVAVAAYVWSISRGRVPGPQQK